MMDTYDLVVLLCYNTLVSLQYVLQYMYTHALGCSAPGGRLSAGTGSYEREGEVRLVRHISSIPVVQPL